MTTINKSTVQDNAERVLDEYKQVIGERKGSCNGVLVFLALKLSEQQRRIEDLEKIVNELKNK